MTTKDDDNDDPTPTPRVFQAEPIDKRPTVKLERPVTPRWERTGPITRPPHVDATKPRDERIVVIEDHADLRESYIDILTEVGYVARGAADGIDGLDKVFGDSVLPDLVLLDIGLPKLSGVGVKACIEAEMGTRNMQPMPIIVITAGSVNRLPNDMRYGKRVFEKNKLGDMSILLPLIAKDIADWRRYLLTV